MRRVLPLLLTLPVLLGAEGDCGGSGGDEPNFGGGGGGSTGDGGSEDGGASDGGASDGGGDGGTADGGSGGDGGTAGDDVFLSVSVDCEGDNSEYTWTYRASLSIQASYVTVEVDPETPDYEAWYLESVDAAQTEWELEVTELLSSRDCSREAELLWTAFGFGSWEETTESSYTP